MTLRIRKRLQIFTDGFQKASTAASPRSVPADPYDNFLLILYLYVFPRRELGRSKVCSHAGFRPRGVFARAGMRKYPSDEARISAQRPPAFVRPESGAAYSVWLGTSGG